jgi:hypothetical protein
MILNGIQYILADQLTGGSNRKRTSDSRQLLLGDKGGVSGVADVDLTGLQEAADILFESALLGTSCANIYTLQFSEHWLTLPPKQ